MGSDGRAVVIVQGYPCFRYRAGLFNAPASYVGPGRVHTASQVANSPQLVHVSLDAYIRTLLGFSLTFGRDSMG